MDSSKNIFRSDPHRLARVFDVGVEVEPDWRKEEFAAILDHQLSAPIAIDLGNHKLNPDLAKAASIKTFDDLFHHPNPPVELLRSAKEFAKSHRNQPNNALPHDIASLLYFASIAVAWTRKNQRITNLSEKEIRAGVAWGMAQPWVDERTKTLFRTAAVSMIQRPQD